MPQITLSNAHGHTVTISGDFENLVSYLLHMRLLVRQAKLRFVELEADVMAALAEKDWELLYDAINELSENH